MAEAPVRRFARPRLAGLGALLLLAAGLAQLAGGGTIQAKAWLAQLLLRGAWEATLAGDRQVRPWPWADTWPVARLRVPALGVEQVVLAGVSGRSLAFAPGHLDGTARPGAAGHAVIAGHRDTHFRFLERLHAGMLLELQGADGGWRSFRVTGSEVIDAREARLASPQDGAWLSLVTCYPFDAIVPGGPLRFVVSAEEFQAEASLISVVSTDAC